MTHFSEMVENNPDPPHRDVVIGSAGLTNTVRAWLLTDGTMGIDITSDTGSIGSICSRDQLRAVMLAIGQALAETAE